MGAAPEMDNKLRLTTAGVAEALRLFLTDPSDPDSVIDQRRVSAFEGDARTVILNTFELNDMERGILKSTDDLRLYGALAPMIQLLRHGTRLEAVAVRQTVSSLIPPRGCRAETRSEGLIMTFGDGRLVIRLRVHPSPAAA